MMLAWPWSARASFAAPIVTIEGHGALAMLLLEDTVVSP